MTDTMKTELKPCPFCESEPWCATSDGFENSYVKCGLCGASGPAERSEDEAIDAWNRRAALAPMKTEQRREAFEKWRTEFVIDKRRVPSDFECWCAALDSQAAQAQPVAWRYRFHTDDSLAGKPNVRPWILCNTHPLGDICITESGIEIEPLYAASPSHSKEPPSDGVQTSKGPSVTNSPAIEFAVVLTGDQQHALRQTLDYLRDQEGKSHQGYFYTGWAGARLREAIDSTHSKEPGELPIQAQSRELDSIGNVGVNHLPGSGSGEGTR